MCENCIFLCSALMCCIVQCVCVCVCHRRFLFLFILVCVAVLRQQTHRNKQCSRNYLIFHSIEKIFLFASMGVYGILHSVLAHSSHWICIFPHFHFYVILAAWAGVCVCAKEKEVAEGLFFFSRICVRAHTRTFSRLFETHHQRMNE